MILKSLRKLFYALGLVSTPAVGTYWPEASAYVNPRLHPLFQGSKTLERENRLHRMSAWRKRRGMRFIQEESAALVYEG